MALLASACGSAADTSATNDDSSNTAEELTPGVHSFTAARTGAATSDTDARSGVLPTAGDGLEAAPVEPLPSGNNLSYGGGRVISNVKAVGVFWNGNVIANIRNNVGGFYTAVTKNPYLDWLNEYDTNIAGGTFQNIGLGSYVGGFQMTPVNKNTVLTDAQIQSELATQITGNPPTGRLLPSPDSNTLYMVHMPPGFSITAPVGPGGATWSSCRTAAGLSGSFCAYHRSFSSNGQTIRYAIVADFSAGSGCDTGCGNGGQFNNTTAAASHEMVEAITDPDSNSAWTSANGEIGDTCARIEAALPGTSYTIQREWSNELGACISVNSGRSYQQLDASNIYVLGTDGKLWLENAPFGSVPPARTFVNGNVTTFQGMDTQNVFLLGTDRNLWFEHAPFGTPPVRERVDATVRTFQAIDGSNVYVLGSDGNLWLEFGPFGTVPPPRQHVDATVARFKAIDTSHALVLGTDGKLWLEQGPFGTVPPTRQEVDATTLDFQYLDSNDILVLGTDRKLWLEHPPFGNIPPNRQQVDATVRSFQALDTNNIYVLGTDGKLWLERGPFGNVPPARNQVDSTVLTFVAQNIQNVLVLGFDHNLWAERAPFGTVPPARTQIDATVAPY